MTNLLKILLVEDSPEDAQIITSNLKNLNLNFETKIVDTEIKFREALENYSPDLILSDHSLPTFNSTKAIELVKQGTKKIPFILITGAISPEFAASCIQDGVVDYIMKDRMERLPVAVLNALEKNILEIEREKYLSNIIANETLFKRAEKVGSFGIWETDLINKTTKWSDETYHILGYEIGEIQPSSENFLKSIHPDDTEETTKSIDESIKNGSNAKIRFRIITKSGSIKYVESQFSIERNDKNEPVRITGFNKDVSERIKSELKLAKANRLYSFISHINQTIVHAEDEETLFKEACRVAVEFGKFKMAWIGIAGKSPGKITMAAHYMATEKIIEMLKDYTYDPDGPIAKVFAGEKYSVVNDVRKKSKIAWETIAGEQKFNSAISLPLKKSGEIKGVLNLYFTEVNFFDESEIKLLEEVSGDISFALDVFEKRHLHQKAEEKIIENEKKYRDLFELNPMPMWVIETETFKFLDVNNAAVKSYGYSREEFLSMTALDIRPEEDKEKFINIDRSSGTGIHSAGDWRHRKKDGSLINIEIKVDDIIFNGRKARLVLANDITEKVRTEKKIERSEANLRAAQAIAHVGSWEVDFATGVSIWSDECCRIYGLTPEENIQSYESWKGFIHPGDLDYVMEMIRLSQTTKTTSSFYHRILRRDGSVRYLYSQPRFKIKDNIPIGLYGVVHDVTEMKIAELERAKLTEDIFKRNKELEQFAYIISHNLRAPVANIIGFAEELSVDNYTEEEKSLFLMELLSGVRRLDEVIMDLNNILHSRQNINEKNEEIFFSQLIYFIKTSIINLINTEQAEIITDFKEVKSIVSVKSYLHSIFYNLIINSIKYKHPDKTPVIEIKAEQLDGKILLTFKDNGMGIDLKTKGNQVFGLYKRFHTRVEGKGIGLFMVKSQVESMGGTIKIKSSPDVGTEFYIELPDTNIS